MSTTADATSAASAPSVLGAIEAIYIARVAGGPMEALQQVTAVAGRGLEGDRYFQGVGTYSERVGPWRQLTMIDAAALEAVERELGIRLDAGRSRRNLVVRGADLPSLLGQTLQVGGALCRVVRLCQPCAYLESITQPGVMRALLDRGGLNLEVLQSGVIHVGDALRLAE